MRNIWLSAVFPIAAIFSFRMFGLFMLIPVFTVFANQLQGATPSLIGFALGSYGLSQAMLQMPFGMLSDRFGRRPILTLGLLLFVSGSLIGIFSHSIYTMILARLLQGGGAIGAVLIALLADLTPEEERTKSMAVVGMSIGLSFGLAMIISPSLVSADGLSGIFLLTTCLALLGLFLLHRIIPSSKREQARVKSGVQLALLKSTLKDKELQRLNMGIFLQHFILTATFYIVPLLLHPQLKQHQQPSWHFYLPLIFFSFITTFPVIFLAEKRKQMRSIFLVSIFLTGLSQLLFIWGSLSLFSLWIRLFFYFFAFNFLEASLPSLISKQAAPDNKGTALGIYSTSQFLGIFGGGILAGIFYQISGEQSIFIMNAILALIWLLISLPLKINSVSSLPSSSLQKQR